MSWVLDLDGVIWLGEREIEGAALAVARLRAAGEQLAFVTNNSFAPRSEVVAKLESFGIDSGCDPDCDVITSAMAAATLVEPGETVYLCGGPGARAELGNRGAHVVDDFGATGPDVVVVGFHRTFDYEAMTKATRAVRLGARLVATNDDATYPSVDGLIPGCGAILASIATASGETPVVAGKPHPPMVRLVQERLGGDGLVVGDRPDTDGLFARAMGFRFGLVLTGVTKANDLPVHPSPDVIAPDLATLVASVLGEAVS